MSCVAHATVCAHSSPSHFVFMESWTIEAANRTDDVVKQLLGKEGDVAQYADAAYDRVPDQARASSDLPAWK